MNELIQINKKGEQVISGRKLHEFLQIETPYMKWFERMCEYGFERGIDFWTKMSKSTGGRPAINHDITLDMAKELCMIQRSDIGRQARRYFIEIEKVYKKQIAIREAGKITRRSLTDVIRDEIPDSPHKRFKYKHFTDLVYTVAIGCSAKKFRQANGLDKEANIREYLSPTQIKAVDKYESLIKDLIRMGWEYEQIANFVKSQLALTA